MKSLKRMNGASSIGQKATKYFAKATYCHNSKLYYDLEKSVRNSWPKTGDRVGFFLTSYQVIFKKRKAERLTMFLILCFFTNGLKTFKNSKFCLFETL